MIDDTFHDGRTRQLLYLLIHAPTGIRFLLFLLDAGTRYGEGYISYRDHLPDSNGGDDNGQTLSSGFIVLLSHLDPVIEASVLVHEAVESYYKLEWGIGKLFGASKAMDYAAEWFQGKFTHELAAARGEDDRLPTYAYGMTYGDWLKGPGQGYGPATDQWEVTNAFTLALSFDISADHGTNMFFPNPGLHLSDLKVAEANMLEPIS
jgi:hypothetical protein